MRVEFGISGEKDASRHLWFVGKRARRLRPAFKAIGRDFRRAEKAQFASEGAYASGGWPPLAPSTIAQRHGKVRILDDTGALRSSLTKLSDPEHIEDATRDSLTFGSRVSYAHYHQTGTRRMPKRPPLAFRRSDKRDAAKTLRRYILTGRVN